MSTSLLAATAGSPSSAERCFHCWASQQWHPSLLFARDDSDHELAEMD